MSQDARQGTAGAGTGDCAVTGLDSPDEAPAAGNGIVEAHGLWWPPNLGATPEEFLRQAEDVYEAVELCPLNKRRMAVQAGGHAGGWPLRLVNEFRAVHTFEPDATNWECLQLNVGNHTLRYGSRIDTHRGLLGAQRGYATLSPASKNSGAGWAAFDNRGPLQVYTVDQFAFDDLDLLCLDVEGAETEAMKGAIDTINRCHPIILYEERGHGYRYGYTPKDTEDFLMSLGYKYVKKVRKDRIWRYAP